MARIAIVETYPYESVWGGDAVYLDRLRQFFLGAGHEVTTYITDVRRGRTDPRLTLHGVAHGRHRWRARQAMPTGPRRFVCWHPGFVPRVLAKAAGRPARRDQALTPREVNWLERQLAASRPHLVILMWGASALAGRLVATGLSVAALPCFFGERKLRLGDAAPALAPGESLLKALTDAQLAGFNNRADLESYVAATGATNAAIVNMSFAPCDGAPLPAARAMLFVAAETRPNVESLLWLTEGVWPAIRAAIPDAQLRVVGSVGRALAGRTVGGVECAGFVDDLDAEYARSALVLAPFVAGTGGVKTKVAEALAHGRAVITTSIGIDAGARDQYDIAVEVADTPEDFAAAAIRLLRDRRELNARTDAAAGQYALHFSEAAAYAPLARLLGNMAS